MTKPQPWMLLGETVSIEGRHGVVISSNIHSDVAGTTGVIEVCWKVGDALGEEVETFDPFDLPASFKVLGTGS